LTPSRQPSFTETSFNSGWAFGSTQAGGLVFFNDGAGKGLVAAPVDQADNIWGGSSGDTPHGYGPDLIINSGITNTTRILTYAGYATSSAAYVAKSYTGGGYSDWHLPAIYELGLLHENLHHSGLGGFTADAYYWSSTDGGVAGASQGWKMNGATDRSGYDIYLSKLTVYKVRAVRRF